MDGLPGRPPAGEVSDPPCPLRTGDTCSLCVPGATGPADCGLVYLVMSDPDLREQWQRRTGARW